MTMYLDSVFTHGGHKILHKKFQVIVGKIEGVMAVFVMLLFFNLLMDYLFQIDMAT